jgi:hypothetical protein
MLQHHNRFSGALVASGKLRHLQVDEASGREASFLPAQYRVGWRTHDDPSARQRGDPMMPEAALSVLVGVDAALMGLGAFALKIYLSMI